MCNIAPRPAPAGEGGSAYSTESTSAAATDAGTPGQRSGYSCAGPLARSVTFGPEICTTTSGRRKALAAFRSVALTALRLGAARLECLGDGVEMTRDWLGVDREASGGFDDEGYGAEMAGGEDSSALDGVPGKDLRWAALVHNVDCVRRLCIPTGFGGHHSNKRRCELSPISRI